MKGYVHGYSEKETERLYAQAGTLSEYLHHDSIFPPGSRVLEPGCGTGAQTLILARNNPGVEIVAVDVSAESLRRAAKVIGENGIRNVTFLQADIFNLPFVTGEFDHLFICFVLEHLSDPSNALLGLKRFIRPGGSVTVIEGDHGSYFSHPQSREACEAVRCLIDMQSRLGGDALIGRRLFPLLANAGFKNVSVSPRMIYVDSSRPDLVEGFTIKTFIAMVEGVKSQAVGAGLIEKAVWEKGVRDLYRAAEKDGTFCYTFFKAKALK